MARSPKLSNQGRTNKTVFARELYDGVSTSPRNDQLVFVENGLITEIRPLAKNEAVPAGTIEAEIAAPGFIDMQINGAADTQFNEEPTADAIVRIAAGARQGGTTHILPTFITAPKTGYRHAVDAVNQALGRGEPGILGVHLEGPFLSPRRPGIHPVSHIRRMSDEDVRIILKAKGTVLVTLAPECQDESLIRQLTGAGIKVFAGHTDASTEEMESAIEAGVSGVTHLFNAQSQLTGREPGVVGSALMRSELSAGIIADGFHVQPQNLRLAARLMGNRLCLVTDAMKTLAGTCDAFDLYGTPVRLREGALRGPDGRLAGAHLAMDEAVRNAIALMGISRSTAFCMASTNVAHALGLEDQLGKVALGYRASITLLDTRLNACGVVADGHWFCSLSR